MKLYCENYRECRWKYKNTCYTGGNNPFYCGSIRRGGKPNIHNCIQAFKKYKPKYTEFQVKMLEAIENGTTYKE